MRNGDSEWVARLREKEESAFCELYQRYQSRVFRLAMRYLRDEQDAEEVVQDVFLTVYRQVDKFREESSFDTWLYRITVNACLMKLRSNPKNRNLSLEDALLNLDREVPSALQAELGDWARLLRMAGSPLEQTYWNELFTEVEKNGEEMGATRWQTFWLSAIDGYSERELIKNLKISPSALKSRIHRSRRYLKKRIKPWLAESQGVRMA